MSAIPGLNPTPVRGEPLSPTIAPHAPARPSRLRLLALLALVGVGGWAAYRYFGKSEAQVKQTQALSAIRTTKVTVGPIQRVLRLNGSTTAKNFASIAAPRLRAAEGGRGLVLIFLVKSGSIVKKGDVVAQIDTQAMKDRLDDIQAQIDSAEADIKKRKAEIAVNWE